jgi:molybdopterin/thiamine biosynthesis adenylyltransferase
MKLPALNAEERATYEWQMWVPGFGEEGQRKLKGASVFISRVGGLGGMIAYQLAAAGVGRLVLAHAGNLKASDLNRQLLMRHDRIGKSRMETIIKRLKEFNPRLNIVSVAENISDANAAGLIAQSDVVVDAAPLFEERYAINRAAVAARKPMVECAMYAMEAHVVTIIPGHTPCLECIFPEKPPQWKREFPVIGAISGTAGCIGAAEVIKLITGLGKPLAGRLLVMDLATMEFRKLKTARRKDCPVCQHIAA